MSKLGIVGATALSLALAVASPAFAGGRVGGGGAMNVGSGGFRDAQASTGSVSASGADASYCRQRWAYYDPASGKYMGDDGEWRPCVNRRGVRRRSAS
jgi:BA14K-like protein